MKKILFILFMLAYYIGYSQIPNTPRSSAFVQANDARLKIGLQFGLPDGYVNTLNSGNDSVGMLFYNKLDRHIYQRDSTAPGVNSWVALFKATDVIYTADETTLHLNSGTKVFSINTNYVGQISITTVGTLTTGNLAPGFGLLGHALPNFPTGPSPIYRLATNGSIYFWDSASYISSINFAKADNLTAGIASFDSLYFRDNGSGLITIRPDTISYNAAQFGVIHLGTLHDSVNIIAAFTNIYNSNGQLTANRHLSGHSTRGLYFDSLAGFSLNATDGTTWFQYNDNANLSPHVISMGDVNFSLNRTRIVIDDGNANISMIGATGMPLVLNTFASSNRVTLHTQLGTTLTNDLYLPQYNSGTDTLATLRDIRTNGVSDVVQAYSSGSTLTQNASTNIIQLNPASTQAALTITSLASGGTWHSSNDLYITAGGTVTSGPVITALSFVGGSGLTVIQAATPTTINAGEVIRYHKIGSFLYRWN